MIEGYGMKDKERSSRTRKIKWLFALVLQDRSQPVGFTGISQSQHSLNSLQHKA